MSELALSEGHTLGEDRWRQAELGTPAGTLLYRVARTPVGSREPLTHTTIVLPQAALGIIQRERVGTLHRRHRQSHPCRAERTGNSAASNSGKGGNGR